MPTGSMSLLQATQMRRLQQARRGAAWIEKIEDFFYVVLQEEDNWSTYGPLNTTWQKLRVKVTPKVGDTSIPIFLHDWAFSKSNGKTSPEGDLETGVLNQIEWGLAQDCRDHTKLASGLRVDAESPFKINLRGTPFAFETIAVTRATGHEAHGVVECSDDRQVCAGRCGGMCGFCGLGHAGQTKETRLAVIDQKMFDAGVQDVDEEDFDDLEGELMSPPRPWRELEKEVIPKAKDPEPSDEWGDEWGGDEWGGDDDNSEEEEEFEPQLVKEHMMCGPRGELLSKSAGDISDCAALAQGAGYRAMAFGTKFMRGRCYAMTLDVDEALCDEWNKHRMNPRCPAGKWRKDKYFDFYALAKRGGIR